MVGFAPSVKRAIIDRDGGRCARCDKPGTDIHHRRPRGMGGSSDPSTNSPANGVLLCRDCHSWVESHRSLATDQGWLVPQRVDPSVVPVWRGGQWWRLDDGGWTPTDLTPPVLKETP